jgi:sodium-dependent dicarboxylate transporter 2/3/5
MGSLIGSPPNLVLAGFLPKTFPGEHSITFLQWLLFGVPVVLLFIPLAWIVLIAFGGEMSFLGKRVKLDVTQAINKEYRALGAVSRQEMAVAMIFSITALLWIFREPIAIGGLTVPGWSRLFPVPGYLQDAVVSIAAGIVLFVIRIEGKPLLLWTEAEKRIPWGVLLLFGGGFALADAFAKSGLAGWTGEHLRGISALPPFFTILCMALITTFLTEIASNTAIAATVLPIFATLVPAGMHPAAFLIPATLGASCAFMLPAATPPNAIVFASGHLTVARMAKTGLIMNLATALLITVLSLTLIPAIFH